MEDRPESILVRMRKALPARRRLGLAAGAVAVALLIFLSLARQDAGRMPSHNAALPPEGNGRMAEIAPPPGFPSLGDDGKGQSALMSRTPLEAYKTGLRDLGGTLSEPRIAYSAELTVVTKEFSHSRASLEEILDRHHGYVAKLRMVGQPAGSVLSATVRVPSSEYRPALAEFKGVGVVEHEEEAADEITQQHSELEARLINAQNEEQRIQRLLQSRTEKIYDYGSLERQVAALHGEIERIEAERYSSGNRVSFANVYISLREERTSPAETIGAKLRNAAVGGLNDALESISAILLFVAGHGPLLTLWAVLLYFPARYIWRRRATLAFGEAEAPKNS